MLQLIFSGLRPAFIFLRGWRRETIRAYQHQYGLFLAVPIIWSCLSEFLWPWFATLGFLLTGLWLAEKFDRKFFCQALIFLIWSGYLTWHNSSTNNFLPALDLGVKVEEEVKLKGRLVGVPTLSPRCTFLLSTPKGLTRIQAEKPNFPLETGQTLALSVQLAPVIEPTNPGQFDYPAYLKSLGVSNSYRAQSITLCQPPAWPWRCVNHIHAILDSALTRSVPPHQAPLLRACLLGSTEGLDPLLIDDFKTSGMLHILAISGQHIGLIALILLQVFALLRLPRKASFLLTALLLGIYVPVCGGSVSVARSALMFACTLPGVLWERPGFALNNLGWAAIFSLLWQPYQILSVGFQLSFAATFFLILYSRPMADLLKRLNIQGILATYIVSTSGLSLILYLAAYPVLAAGMHMVAPSSLLGNLATIGLSSGMLVASCMVLLFQPLPWIPNAFGEAAGLFSQALSACIHGLAHAPGAAQSIVALPWVWGFFLILVLVAFPSASRMGYGRTLILFAITAFAGRWAYDQSISAWKDPVSVAFLDVGQGDGALCQLPGATILIDAGPIEAGRNVILPYLRYHGINRLEMVIVTHPDLDHYGGLSYVVEHMEIGCVLYPGIEAETQAWKGLRTTLLQKGIPMIAVHRGQSLYSYPEISLSVLSPGKPNQFEERNDNSVVTLLEIRGEKILFTGDMEASAQNYLMGHAWPELSGIILKVPHHGSDRSNPERFLEAIHPKIAILSAGRKNRFGHPGSATVATLKAMGSAIFLTARQGGVFFNVDRYTSHWSTWGANM
jgi:competence protein ComEC